jgi:hypothetical protein
MKPLSWSVALLSFLSPETVEWRDKFCQPISGQNIIGIFFIYYFYPETSSHIWKKTTASLIEAGMPTPYIVSIAGMTPNIW